MLVKLSALCLQFTPWLSSHTSDEMLNINYISCISHLFLLLLTAVLATTTVVTTIPQQYPQQPTATPVQSYQGSQYPPYQPVPVQPGYPAQPMPRGYGPQPMPTSPYQGQPFTAGPPPTYQEASKWILVTKLIVESGTTTCN